VKLVYWIIGIGLVYWLYSSSLSSSKSSSSSYTTGRYDEYEAEIDDDVTSDNWNCTEDCSGHEAGYEWASDNGISDSSDCGGNSNSFIEGCEAYANEQEMDAELEYDSDILYNY
jgi:hypothetical protein